MRYGQTVHRSSGRRATPQALIASTAHDAANHAGPMGGNPTRVLAVRYKTGQRNRGRASELDAQAVNPAHGSDTSGPQTLRDRTAPRSRRCRRRNRAAVPGPLTACLGVGLGALRDGQRLAAALQTAPRRPVHRALRDDVLRTRDLRREVLPASHRVGPDGAAAVPRDDQALTPDHGARRIAVRQRDTRRHVRPVRQQEVRLEEPRPAALGEPPVGMVPGEPTSVYHRRGRLRGASGNPVARHSRRYRRSPSMAAMRSTIRNQPQHIPR